MPQIADRIQLLEESATLALAKRVRALRAEGKDVLPLTLGEPDFETPEHIREAAIQAIREGDTHYPPVAGQPALREAVADYFRKQSGIICTADNILISTGAKQSLINVLWALVNSGDEVIILAPYWVSYLPMVQMVGGRPVIVRPESTIELKVSPDRLAEAITDRTRVVMLNSPNNPSGVVYSPEEIRAFAEVLVKHPHVAILSDEIYEQIRYGAEHLSIGSLPELADRVVTVNGVSKAFAMTGWRIGFTCAPVDIARAAEKLQGQVTSGASSISQRAALAAMTGDMEPTHSMVASFRERRDQFCAALLAGVPHVQMKMPEGAFYAYPNFEAYLGLSTASGARIDSSTALNEYLLEEAMVCGVPGDAFGTAEHIRFSYASSLPLLLSAADRISDAMVKLS